MAGRKGPRALPDGIAGPGLSASEERYVASAGEEPLAADSGAETTAGNDTQPADHGSDTIDGGAGRDSLAGADTVQGAAEHKPGHTVPVGELVSERKARQAAETENATLRERTAQLLQAFTEGKIAPVQAPAPVVPEAIKLPEIPAFEVDPANHIMATLAHQAHAQTQNRQLLEAVAQLLVGQHQQTEEQRVEQTRQTQQRTRLIAAQEEFVKEAPDYIAASTFLNDIEHQDLIMMGYSDPAVRSQMLGQKASGIIARAEAAGTNPHKVAYDLAVRRGYKKADGAPANGVAAPAAARVASAAAGQRVAGPSLAGVRGAGPKTMTVDTLLKMSPAEWEEAMKTSEGKALLGN